MYDHVGLHVQDLEASVRFYQAALAPLGHVLCMSDANSAGFGPKDAPSLWLYHDAIANMPVGAHVAFRAEQRSHVDKFHTEGLRAGGQDLGKPGVREDYAPNYYAAFLTDPDGNNIEAVCMTQ
ncbi:VOC family protein [Dyella choica]|uniref:VOC family protein n=1 Tax=Dyella choica TaxID=1927959 RepID=A0A3S0S8N8_9GAMM|nr:VOC family protein [Dyella choica]RUL73067.1 VOC family protein [Dyella choica]